MAPFFHLTHLGYQQPIKSFVLAPPLPPAPEKFTLPEIKGYGKGKLYHSSFYAMALVTIRIIIVSYINW
jgi:hypothetical protein